MIRRIAFWPSQLPCRNEKSHFSCHLQLAPCYFTASLGECYIVFTPAQGHAVQVFSPLIVLMLTPSSTFLYFLPPSPPSFSLPFFPSSQWLASSWQAFVLRHADIEMLIQHQYNWNDIDWVTAAKYDCAYVRFGVSTAKFTLMYASELWLVLTQKACFSDLVAIRQAEQQQVPRWIITLSLFVRCMQICLATNLRLRRKSLHFPYFGAS